MAKQQFKDELMAEFFRMLMADAQQAQKESGARCAEGHQAAHLAEGDCALEHQSKTVRGPHPRADGLDGRAPESVPERRLLFCSGLLDIEECQEIVKAFNCD